MNIEEEVWMNHIKEITVKSFTFLIQSRAYKHNIEKLCELGIETTISKATKLWHETKRDSEAFLEIFIQTEGCHPLLIERWQVKFSQICISSSYSQSQADLFLRSIMQLSTILPKLTTSNLEFKLCTVPSLIWPKTCQGAKSYPSNPLKLALDRGNISIFCETLTSLPLPEIKQQELGNRPRLTSIDENTYKDSDVESNISADEPIICLTQLDMNKYKTCQHLKYTAKLCSHEHDSIGFIPLSHTICTEECSDCCCSEASIGTEALYSNPFEEKLISEDAAISIYKISCEKMRQAKLFEGYREISLDNLRSSLRRMQNTLDLI